MKGWRELTKDQKDPTKGRRELTKNQKDPTKDQKDPTKGETDFVGQDYLVKDTSRDLTKGSKYVVRQSSWCRTGATSQRTKRI